MNLKIKNFGKIAEADVKLDGITVICGNNKSGKSTVGKALFAFFDSLYDYKYKIFKKKLSAIGDFIFSHSKDSNGWPWRIFDSKNPAFSFITEHNSIYTLEEVKGFLDNNFSIKATKEKLMPLIDILNTPDIDILNRSVFLYFDNLMNGQIKNTKSKSGNTCLIEGKFRDGKNTIRLFKNKADCVIDEPITHHAYYINSPFILDRLNNQRDIYFLTPMERSVITAIIDVQDEINSNSMNNILNSVVNAKDLKEVRKVLKRAYEGDTKLSNGKYFYNENGVDFDIRNISAGLKSFALIERMLETGVLKKKDVLILDEPEIYLHSEWQIIYAELIVMLQKQFDLTILIVTHSFQFLESLDFFMKKYGISDKGNYYIPEDTDKGVTMRSCGNDALELKKKLTTGSVILSNMKFEYEMENRSEEDN